MPVWNRDGRGRRIEEPMRRANNGQFADDWRAARVAIGKVMREHKEKGHCEGCSFFKKPKLSPSREAQFKSTWGTSSFDITEERCTASVDNFDQDCPEREDRHYHIGGGYYVIEKKNR